MADIILQQFDSSTSNSVNDASISSGGNTLTSGSANFTAGDVGKYIVVDGAGTSGNQLQSKIQGYVNSSTVTLADYASTTVTKAHAFYGSYKYQFFVKNRINFNITMDMPVIAEDMPEADKTKNTITKVQGNTMNIFLTFKLIDMSTVQGLTSLVQDGSGNQILGILTPIQQLSFLLDTFENKSINSMYKVALDSSVTPTFGYPGVMTKLEITQGESDAANWQCNVNFQVGNVITVVST